MDRDWFDTDYYKSLGVSRDATPSDVKKAYRTLARKHHPDRADGDSDLFDRATKAYEVLSSPDARKEYDEFTALGKEDPQPQSQPFGFQSDIFDMFGFQPPRPARGRDAEASLSVKLLETLDPLVLPLKLTGQWPCRACNAQGYDQYGVQCHECQGETVTQSTREISVRLPPGIRDGSRVKLKGRGLPGPGGPGDLYVNVSVTPDPLFHVRDGSIAVQVAVPFPTMALGGIMQVPLPRGGHVTLQIPAGTPNGRILKVKGKGFAAKSMHGALLVVLEVSVPKSLPEDARRLLEEYAKASSALGKAQGDSDA